MKILKFGGTSLASKESLEKVRHIIRAEAQKDRIFVVVSAIGETTEQLIELIDKAKSNDETYPQLLHTIIAYHQELLAHLRLHDEFKDLKRLLNGIALVGECTDRIRDKILAFGERLSALLICNYLLQNGFQSKIFLASDFLKTNENYGEAEIIHDISRDNVIHTFHELEHDCIPVITGFIASSLNNNITLLGRNGSNYTASLLANYLNADELQIWTDVEGIYTANPRIVREAKVVERISYAEANELAHYGTSLIHAKSILPAIEKKIPILIRNTFKPNGKSTIISENTVEDGVRVVSASDHVALVYLEGRGLRGRIGIDAKIFEVLSRNEISVIMISQASSERSIGLVVERKQSEKAVIVLKEAFDQELKLQDITAINAKKDVALLSLVGKNLPYVSQIFKRFKQNHIGFHLIANAINGSNISFVIDRSDLNKASQIAHSQIHGIPTKIHVIIFGHGLVGKEFLRQLKEKISDLENQGKYHIQIYAIANSKGIQFHPNLEQESPFDTYFIRGISSEILLQKIREERIENPVLIDLTASEELAGFYPDFLNESIHIVAANKIANSQSFNTYETLRKIANKNALYFRYEANVGAGLPIIDTLRNLMNSGDRIHRIRAILSGSVTFLLKEYSLSGEPIATALKKAIDHGYTEPDFNLDLQGLDVARKIVILAREIGLTRELSDVKIRPLSKQRLDQYNDFHEANCDDELIQLKKVLKADEIIRYIADISPEESSAGFEIVSKESNFYSLNGADVLFEIYSDRYAVNPFVIKGAGAGSAVTAQAVLFDLNRIASYLTLN